MHSSVVDVLIITCTFVKCLDHLNYQCDLDNIVVRPCNYQLNHQCDLDNIVVKGVHSSVVAKCLDYYRLI